jgi:hypothetical protein
LCTWGRGTTGCGRSWSRRRTTACSPPFLAGCNLLLLLLLLLLLHGWSIGCLDVAWFTVALRFAASRRPWMPSSTATGMASPASPPCSPAARRRGSPVSSPHSPPAILLLFLANQNLILCFSISLTLFFLYSSAGLNFFCHQDWPGVVRVVRNRVLDLHTTRSWDFMGVNPSPSGGGILLESRFGEDSIIGVLDTGELTCSSSCVELAIASLQLMLTLQCED